MKKFLSRYNLIILSCVCLAVTVFILNGTLTSTPSQAGTVPHPEKVMPEKIMMETKIDEAKVAMAVAPEEMTDIIAPKETAPAQVIIKDAVKDTVKEIVKTSDMMPVEQSAPIVIGEETEAVAKIEFDVEKALKDRVLGDVNAPVTIIEYASLTCSHCANFHTNVLPEVKAKLIETGKAKIIFRDFPLDGLALKASMMLRCAPEENYFNLLEVLFNNQERWTHTDDPLNALAQLGVLAGVSKELFLSCMENKELETGILNGLQVGQVKYKVKSTPTFIFGDNLDKISGVHPAEKFEKIVAAISAMKK